MAQGTAGALSELVDAMVDVPKRLERIDLEHKRDAALLRERAEGLKASAKGDFVRACRAAYMSGLCDDEAALGAAVAGVYWHSSVSTTWIEEGFALTRKTLTVLVHSHPLSLGEPCLVCGAQLQTTSRTDRDRLMKADHPSHCSCERCRWRLGICPGCWPACCICGKPTGTTHPEGVEWFLRNIREGQPVGHSSCLAEPETEEPLEQSPPASSGKKWYVEYLRSDHWQSVRRWALERAEFRCQLCNTQAGTLHVHHRTYERVGHEKPGDVIVLCERHHAEFHERERLTK